MTYSPVVVFTYNRYDEIVRVMDALSENIDADKTDVFVFSNAPIDGVEGDVEKVSQIRNALTLYKNAFHKYSVIERKENTGVNANMIPGIDEIVQKYGRVIVLEDDILTGKNFLSFMNQALDFYENDQEIFSICGYNPVSLNSRLQGDTFSYDAFRSWGWGIWKDRWDTFDFNEDTVSQIDLKKAHSEALMYVSPIRYDILCPNNGSMRYLDFKLACKQMADKKTVIYSKQSFCENIGLTGNGQSTPLDNLYSNTNFRIDDSKTEFVFSKHNLNIKSDPDYFFVFREEEFAMRVYYDLMFERNFLQSNVYCGLSYIYANKGDIVDYFIRNRIYNIAIYGWSDLGNYLYELLKDECINVRYVVDRNVNINDSRLSVYHTIENLPKVDAIVVTALRTFADIERDLTEYVDADIICVDDIVADCKREIQQKKELKRLYEIDSKYKNIMESNICATTGKRKVRIKESFLLTQRQQEILLKISEINNLIFPIMMENCFLFGIGEQFKYLFGITQLYNLRIEGIFDFYVKSSFCDTFHNNKIYPILYPEKEFILAAKTIVITDFKNSNVIQDFLNNNNFQGEIIIIPDFLDEITVFEKDDIMFSLAMQLNKINHKLNKCINKKIAVYGMGDHTQNLLKYSNLQNMRLDKLIDRNVNVFNGVEVLKPIEESFEGIDITIISSFLYQSEIVEFVKTLDVNAELLMLYDEHDNCEFYRVYNIYAPDFNKSSDKKIFERDDLSMELEKVANYTTINSDYYVTYSIMKDQAISGDLFYLGESGVIDAKKYSKFNKNIAIILQGPIIYDGDFTLNTIILYKRIFPNVTIILSTWEDEADKSGFEKFQNQNIEILLNSKPFIAGVMNVNMQLVSTYNAILRAEELGISHVIKTRTDFRIYAEQSLAYLYTLENQFPVFAEKRGRLVILNPYIEVPYYIPDYLMFGRIAEMKKFWDGNELFQNHENGDNPEQLLYKRYLGRIGKLMENPFEDINKYFDLLCSEFIVTDSVLYKYIWKKYTYENYIQFEENYNMINAADWWIRQLEI